MILVWLLGVLLLVARLILRGLRVRRLLKTAAPVEDDSAQALLRSVAAETGLRRCPPMVSSAYTLSWAIPPSS